MSAEWSVIGQVGNVSKNGGFYTINIADNRFYNGKKTKTIWFNCLSRFKPRIKKGDRVLARGHFDESKNEGFQYAMIVDHIGVINEQNQDRGLMLSLLPSMLDSMDDDHRRSTLELIFTLDGYGMEDMRESVTQWAKNNNIDLEQYL